MTPTDKPTQVGGLLPLPDFLGMSVREIEAACTAYAQANVQAEREKFSQLEARLVALEKDAAEGDYVIQQMGRLLAEIAVIVNGPEPPSTRWSYHDLPAKVCQLKESKA
jgi:hypothetical protein